MKKLLYLGIVLMFASCNNNNHCGNGVQDGDETGVDCGGSCGSIELESPIVDGREVSTIKIDNLEVMPTDVGNMNWKEAKNACEKLGCGWRLPTKDELHILYENKDEIGNFADFYYWSSTEYDSSDAWGQRFSFGDQGHDDKSITLDVRAVRSRPGKEEGPNREEIKEKKKIRMEVKEELDTTLNSGTQKLKSYRDSLSRL